MITKKYQLIVCDPPWDVKKLTRKVRPNQVNMDYKTMSLDSIRNLPVSTLAEENCWLFLWTTQKYLFDAKSILEGWGFNHLLTMVWEKTYGRSSGMPLYGFRWNGEFILVGYKKKPPLWPKRVLIPAVFSAENIKHSQKPEAFYKMIESLGEKKIDLFARKKERGGMFGEMKLKVILLFYKRNNMKKKSEREKIRLELTRYTSPIGCLLTSYISSHKQNLIEDIEYYDTENAEEELAGIVHEWINKTLKD